MATMKFMQVLDTRIWKELGKVAKQRGINVQELIRVELVPTFLYGPIEFDKKTIRRFLKLTQNGSIGKVSGNRQVSNAAR